ncbi:hypothetical protein PIB30_012912 [Stylosanthes scabra]|uniref:Uncharacterized protein n=1 Tax=Stylosanthes scabra TaxID=79078 RepID=A0ABU6X4F3_9FABA|nr:hypothetical protein [Stylosanthes scabra]
MDRKRKLVAAKGKGKLAMPRTRKSPCLAGLPPSLPPTPKSVLGPNKLLVLAIAAAKVETHHKAQENIQAPVVKLPTDIKGKKNARISMKPLRKRFSQRIIARCGPSRPKPKKVEVIDLISDEEEEAQEIEVAMEPPTLDRGSMMILTTGTMTGISTSEAPMWPVSNQLLPKLGILPKKKRRTAPPRLPQKIRDRTPHPHSTKVVQFSKEGGKLQIVAV